MAMARAKYNALSWLYALLHSLQFFTDCSSSQIAVTTKRYNGTLISLAVSFLFEITSLYNLHAKMPVTVFLSCFVWFSISFL